ncbi:hypothetical protein LSH36_54g10014 [Paralvinella palmiformis]|uniref:Uncharacterized protein n=1 Tax=Paralvinella palmiformis TaxID=53620 RepID=A0AAD9K684_9ANNE|nr:hypothetical protein LSH36_54g10014 [Paralvinella palmiformis]
MKSVTISSPHIHDPHDTTVSAILTTMLEHAGSSRETFTGITSNAPMEVCAELGNAETIKWPCTALA